MLNGQRMFIAFTIVLAGLHPTGLASASECSQGSRTSGDCPSIESDVGPDSVTIGGSLTSPGSSGSSSDGSPGLPAGTVTTSPSAGNTWTPPPPRAPVLGTPECPVIVAGRCRGSSPPRTPPLVVAPGQPGAPSVVAPTPPSTVSDLARFRPQPSSFVLEPGLWSLPRLSTNMYATARTHSVAGELLGWPIEVRFTPRSFRWVYGDGSGATTSTRGATWGSQQFSATTTSHIYREPGTFLVGLSIDYSVAYRFVGGAFTSVSGRVTQTLGSQQLTVLRVSPVLVDQGCEVGSLRAGRC
jgi:hypothetical protein